MIWKYHIISYRTISYHIISHHIISYHIYIYVYIYIIVSHRFTMILWFTHQDIATNQGIFFAVDPLTVTNTGQRRIVRATSPGAWSRMQGVLGAGAGTIQATWVFFLWKMMMPYRCNDINVGVTYIICYIMLYHVTILHHYNCLDIMIDYGSSRAFFGCGLWSSWG